MGEGAGVILIESLQSAQDRGAEIYCEIVGYGASCDAHHITTPAPGGSGLADAMERGERAKRASLVKDENTSDGIPRNGYRHNHNG